MKTWVGILRLNGRLVRGPNQPFGEPFTARVIVQDHSDEVDWSGILVERKDADAAGEVSWRKVDHTDIDPRSLFVALAAK